MPLINRNVSFIKAADNWKLDVFASFLNLLYFFRLRQGCKDKLCWAASKRRFLTLDCSTMSLFHMTVLFSLGRVFGE